MYTEETGLFSRIKGLFVSNEAVEETNAIVEEQPEVMTEANEASVEIVEEVRTMVSEKSVTAREIPLRTVEVSAPTYILPNEKDLDIRFATKYIQAGGKFIYCESLKEAIEQLQLLKGENGWQHIFTWENEIKDAFSNFNFQRGAIGFTIENSEAAISLCESLIAEDGTILLNPKQASRRQLPCFPKTHIIITDVAHLAAKENDALERFYALNKGELPSLIKLGNCNNGHFYDKQRLILNAEGTEDIYVILVDEVIPPSLRP